MIHILALHQNIDEVCASLTKDFARPCYLVSALDRLTLSSLGCREHNSLSVVLPLQLDEKLVNPFEKYGLHTEYREETVYLTDAEAEAVSAALKPFVHTYYKRAPLHLRLKTGAVKVRSLGIRFIKSQPFERPVEVREHWHVGTKTKEYTTVQPPGQYNGSVTGFVRYHNRLMVADLQPGPCIVCRGTKGERRHFGVMALGPDPYMTSHICRACFSKSFDEILSLMGEDITPKQA